MKLYPKLKTCKVCGNNWRNKGFTTIGGHKACSIHYEINKVPIQNDKCSKCSSPVWVNYLYIVNWQMCCSAGCREEAAEYTGNLCSTKKVVLQKNTEFLNPYPNERRNENKNYKVMNVGATNYALDPRDIHTTDYDVGPGDQYWNVYDLKILS